MALHEIGKLKIRIGREGFGIKIGDRKLFSFGSKSAGPREDADGGYTDYRDDPGYAYDDQNGYYPDEESGYDDYNGGDGYYDQNGDGGYYPPEGDGYYPEDGAPQAGRVMEYIENNAWVVLALLVVFPPLGIYLLWRLNRYEFRVRMAVSVVSGIWCIVALILIISGIVGGGKDVPTLPEMTLTTMAPTAAPTATPAATSTATATVVPELTPAATPLNGGVPADGTGGDGTGTGDEGDSGLTYVYSPQTGMYYHKVDNCSNIDAGAQLTLVTLDAAVNRNQSPCPLCCGGEVYYATADGKWYHTDRYCQGMTNAVEYSKEAATNDGKTACPVCAGGKETTDKDEGKTKAQRYAESITTDKSGIEVYMTPNGNWFHTDSTCQGMSDARKVTLLKALQAGKTGCPVCFASANKLVYCTSGGIYYHLDKNCKDMENASQVTLAAAAVLGKKKCPDCVTQDFYDEPTDDGSDDSGTPDGDIEIPSGDGSTAYVYATPGGRYYHTNSVCSDMKNAEKVTLLSMIKEGRPPCSVCCSSASDTVYVSKGGKYYHSYATCSGMTNAQAGTLAQALAYGYRACSKCWSGTTPIDDGGNGDGDNNDGSDDGNKGYSNVYIYASENGKYYHTRKSCSKAESDVSKVLLELAIDDGKTACPTCASQADDTVYATRDGKYYHSDKSHAGAGATSGTLAKALIHGYTACPVCYKSGDDGGSSKYEPGKSGINVYANASGKYYHTTKKCSAISGSTVKVTLEAALNNNKSACTVCAASARRTVYATKDGKYYHYSSSCAGSSASSGTLDGALALGFKACPNCVTGNGGGDDDKQTFEPGKSGIKVYATTNGKYFHTKSSCGSMTDGKKITLEDALNYGLSACPNCAAAAAKKVYAVDGAGTYHYSESCAGTGAKSGTMAEALALGMKPCSKCVVKDNTDPTNPDDPDDPDKGDDPDRAAPGDTKVYIDLTGNTNAFLYHKASSCAECGMTGGTAVTLKYALDQGFADCGHCNPPLAIEK
jgi:hypothetical protein